MGEAKRRGNYADRFQQAIDARRVKINKGVLYKFLPRHYAESLVSNGGLRVGTSHEYRNAEAHAGTILDKEEGKKDVFMRGAALG